MTDPNGNATPTVGDGTTTYSYDALDRLTASVSRRLAEWCDRYRLNPLARSEWAARLAHPSLAEEIRRRVNGDAP